MKPPQAQLFLSVVLLDAIREDIDQNKKLNVQYYEALKRALYKPGAFFKGIIFPMLDVSLSFFSLKRQALNTCNDIARLYFKAGHNCRFHPFSNQDPRAARLGCLTSHRRNGLFWYSIMLSWACTV